MVWPWSYRQASSAPTQPPLDPTIILRDPTCNTTNPCIIATGGSFGLQVENDGGGVFDIENDTGFTWTSLTFSLSLLAPSNESIFGCDGGIFFQHCSIGKAGSGPNGTDVVDAFFFGLGSCHNGYNNCQGIPNGGSIFFDLDTPCPPTAAACGSWQPNSVATVSPNPEPETFVLLLTGFLPLLPFRKRLFNSRSSA